MGGGGGATSVDSFLNTLPSFDDTILPGVSFLKTNLLK
jgi:hypothetical protein